MRSGGGKFYFGFMQEGEGGDIKALSMQTQ